jgi:hypothetical protein
VRLLMTICPGCFFELVALVFMVLLGKMVQQARRKRLGKGSVCTSIVERVLCRISSCNLVGLCRRVAAWNLALRRRQQFYPSLYRSLRHLRPFLLRSAHPYCKFHRPQQCNTVTVSKTNLFDGTLSTISSVSSFTTSTDVLEWSVSDLEEFSTEPSLLSTQPSRAAEGF